MRAKATNQGNLIWPSLKPPEGFMQGPYPSGRKYANPPAPGKVRSSLGPASPGAVEHALKEGSGRITKINGATREGIRRRINEAIEQGMSPAEAGKYVREWTGFDEYRAERIARTEMMFSYNAAATRTYATLGVTHVVADDGDEDEECAERHGQVFTVEEAEGILDHPNGTLDWLPVEPTMGAEQLRGELSALRPFSGAAAPAPVPTFLPGPQELANALQAHLANQMQQQATLALEKLKQGATLTADEAQLVTEATQAGHISAADAMFALQEGQKRNEAKQLLAKLNAGEDLTGSQMDAIDVAIDNAWISEADAQAAISKQLLIKQMKATANDYLAKLHQGQDIGWNGAKSLEQYVQAGVIDQSQVDAAYAAKQLAAQKMAIQTALDAMEHDVATDAEKQLVMDALSSGALDTAQQQQLTTLLNAQWHAAQAAQQAALTMPATQAEWDNALLQVITKYATKTEKDQVLMGIKQGMLDPQQELGVAKGLVKLLKSGQQLDQQQMEIAQALLDKGVMSPSSWQNGLNALAQSQGITKQHLLDKIAQGQSLDAHEQQVLGQLQQSGQVTTQEVVDALAKVPTSAPPPTVTQTPAQAATNLKGHGGAKVKDKFNPNTFKPKDYADRASHARALATWQSKTNKALSWEGRQAMSDYTGSGYREMNSMLRGVNLNYYGANDIQRLKRSTDLVRESMHPTTQDVVVRRGMGTHIFGPGGNTKITADEMMATVQPGDQFIEGGFMSTSINRGHSWSGDVLLELKVPKGTSAAWAQSISVHKQEYEILLDAGTRIEVESVTRNPYGGQITVVAHVVPR